MPRTLKTIAKHINEHPDLGLVAEVRSSWSNTDRAQPAGLRYRIHTGKGRNGLKLTVKLVRTGEVVCEHDSSETYRTNSEVEEWLTKWEQFDRQYKGRSAPGGGHMVVGEQTMKRGRVLTVGQLKALPDGARVWVRIKEHGEDFRRCDDALTFTRKDTEYLFPGMDFCLTDWDVPKGDDEKLDWSDDEVAISLASVRFVTVKTGRG